MSNFHEELLKDFDFNDTIRIIIDRLPLALAIIAFAIVLHFVVRRTITFFSQRTSPTFAGPTKRASKFFFATTAVILVCGVYGADLGGLWAIFSTTLALVAVGFVAIWSVLSNISCTVLILFFRPFEIGDEIEFLEPPLQGRVVNLNFAYTTLTDAGGSLIQIPNNLFFQKVIKRRRNIQSTEVTLAEQLKKE